MAFDIRSAYTLAEVIAQNNPRGGVYSAFDPLKNAKKPLIEEGYWKEASDKTVHIDHKWTQRPGATPVRHNTGAPFSAATQKPVKEELMRMEMNMFLDVRSLEKSNDPAKFRVEREKQHFLGVMDTFNRVMWGRNDPIAGTALGYKSVNDLSIDGIAARRSALAAGTVISMGGSSSGSMGSIYLIRWGDDGVQFMYPQGGQSTLVETDKTASLPEGQQVSDASGYPYWAVITNWAWEFGLMIAQDGCCQRLCNITASGNGSIFGDTDVTKGEFKMLDMLASLPDGNTDNAAFYMPRAVYAQFLKRAYSKNGNITWADVWGRPQMIFAGVPLLVDDTLDMLEATVS